MLDRIFFKVRGVLKDKFHEDYPLAFAFQEMKGITQTQAYQAASMAADLHITQLVDGNVGVHMMIRKDYLKR